MLNELLKEIFDKEFILNGNREFFKLIAKKWLQQIPKKSEMSFLEHKNYRSQGYNQAIKELLKGLK